ncbi:hypothetical protein BDB00DRAFT_772737 [Zychaea mexicana]|uniref:uncharacterized protein n=1 Tax=Zychaea mexicana TaxID=64656 RepID=UPI0022FE550F|nr:uncharacterized protein BDB00DRAFT_772737 [Zychaea mexicana]KAI9488322.1 hypothetical protein BDB00DRAFT_772737 [Zychaea mexicana]
MFSSPSQSGFNATLRRTQGWAPKGGRLLKSIQISILGATSVKGLIKISLRQPIPSSKEKKASW